MRITDLLDKRSISLNETPKTKSEALDRIIDLMVASGKINDREAYREQVYAREEESTTGIGEGIAIPHGKCDAVTKPAPVSLNLQPYFPVRRLLLKELFFLLLLSQSLN